MTRSFRHHFPSELQGTAVTDAGLPSLAAVKSLAAVQLGKKSKVSAQAVDRLRRARPELTVTVQ